MKLTRKTFTGLCEFSGAELAFDCVFPDGCCPSLRELARTFQSTSFTLAPGWVVLVLAKTMPSAKIRRWQPDLPPRPNRGLRLYIHAWLWGTYRCSTGKGFFSPDNIRPDCGARIERALDILEPVKPRRKPQTKRG